MPAGWVENEVNGEKARWLRLRIVSGDYGHPLSVDVVPDPNDNTKFIVSSVASTLEPPIVTHLGVNYYFFTNPQAPEFCVTENDFAWAEHSDDARWPRSAFAPFAPVADRTPALHFGFSSQPAGRARQPAGPRARPGGRRRSATLRVGLLGQPRLDRAVRCAMPRWACAAPAWSSSSAPPMLCRARDWAGRPTASARGSSRAWAARARSCDWVACWLNAAWGRQGQRIERDGLGTSNGNPHQTFALPIVRALGARPAAGAPAAAVALDALSFERALDLPVAGVPILGDELVEVREWAGRGDDWQTALAGVAAADLRFEADPQDPGVKTAAWVRWHPQPHLYRSGPHDRHYVVERARGVFEFPGADGLIPPAGAPIVVSYVTGGGIAGNVPAGAVRELRSGVGFVESVSNPVPASGGAAAELLRPARDRSAQQVRHRGRAVSKEDFEWLALAASSEVARVRALPLEGLQGRGARGCVGIVLVPHSSAAQPVASPELERTVIDALARRAPAGIAGGIRIVAPSYVGVGVRAEILPLRAEEAGRVEALVRMRLLPLPAPAGRRPRRPRLGLRPERVPVRPRLADRGHARASTRCASCS